MKSLEIIGVVLSSTLLSAVATSLFGAFSNSKKDYIENITKERKEWRDYLRTFVEEVNNCKNIGEVEKYIQLLKVRINPYGLITNHVLDDDWLWAYIETIDFTCKKKRYLSQIKSKLSSLISCLLKYDWERSKEEIKGNSETKLLTLAVLISFLLYSFKHFLSGDYILEYHKFLVIFAFSSFINFQVMTQANKWKRKSDLLFCIGVVLSIAMLFFCLYTIHIRSCGQNDIFDFIIVMNPYIAFVYSFSIKIIRYRNNVGRLAKTIMKITEMSEVPSKWKIFVKQDNGMDRRLSHSIFDEVYIESQELNKITYIDRIIYFLKVCTIRAFTEIFVTLYLAGAAIVFPPYFLDKDIKPELLLLLILLSLTTTLLVCTIYMIILIKSIREHIIKHYNELAQQEAVENRYIKFNNSMNAVFKNIHLGGFAAYVVGSIVIAPLCFFNLKEAKEWGVIPFLISMAIIFGGLWNIQDYLADCRIDWGKLIKGERISVTKKDKNKIFREKHKAFLLHLFCCITNTFLIVICLVLLSFSINVDSSNATDLLKSIPDNAYILVFISIFAFHLKFIYKTYFDNKEENHIFVGFGDFKDYELE